MTRNLHFMIQQPPRKATSSFEDKNILKKEIITQGFKLKKSLLNKFILNSLNDCKKKNYK